MKREIVKQMVEVEKTFYIADDGTVFSTQNDCNKYERSIFEAKLYKEIERLRVKNLDEVIPPSYICDENHSYTYYFVNSIKDYHNLIDYYFVDATYCKREIDLTFPTIMIIEEDYYDTPYLMDLKDIRNEIDNYFKEVDNACTGFKDWEKIEN